MTARTQPTHEGGITQPVERGTLPDEDVDLEEGTGSAEGTSGPGEGEQGSGQPPGGDPGDSGSNGNGGGDAGTTDDELDIEDPAVSMSILSSNRMWWFHDPETDKWYVTYRLPNSRRRIAFEADPEQMDALFGAGVRPTKRFAELDGGLRELLTRENVVFGGNIAEVEGEGDFIDEYNRVLALALDEGKLPPWAENDPKALDLVFLAQSEGKSAEWLIDQLSRLRSFKQRYPGVNALVGEGLTVSEAVQGFLELELGTKRLARSFGQDDALVTPQVVGALLTGGWSLTDVQETYRYMKRYRDNEEALNAFNQIVQENFGRTLTVPEMLEFVAGNAPQELYDLYEASSIQEAANAAGLGNLFDAADAIEVALNTTGVTTVDQATTMMQRASQLLLRFRHEVDLQRFGLTHEELIDLSLNQMPRSGRTMAEINENLDRALQEARGYIENRRAQPFTGFSVQGLPQEASLGALRQQT